MLTINEPIERKHSSDVLEQTYRKIQFIGMCICATPGDLEQIEEMSDNGVYLGVDDVQKDLNDRIQLVINSIKSASNQAEKASDVLKVFVVPEFFFRGNRGAYRTGKNSYAFFVENFKKLIDFIALEPYDSWLFVLGSLLTTKHSINKDAEPTKSLYHTGDALLNVYHRLYPQDSTQVGTPHVSLHDMLKAVDEDLPVHGDLSSATDLAFQDVLKRTLNNCDAEAGIIVDNSCFIVAGGINKTIFRVLKKHKSKEDFVLNSTYKEKDTGYLQSITKYTVIDEASELKPKTSEGNIDPHAILYYGGIHFGIDICLDHSRQRLLNHLKKHEEQYVDVQIVTSCGMEIRPNAVTAKKGCWVFNCDSEYALKNKAKGNDGEHSHTSLMQVKTVIDPNNANSEAALSSNEKLSKSLSMNASAVFYPYEKFDIHVYPVKPVWGTTMEDE